MKIFFILLLAFLSGLIAHELVHLIQAADSPTVKIVGIDLDGLPFNIGWRLGWEHEVDYGFPTESANWEEMAYLVTKIVIMVVFVVFWLTTFFRIKITNRFIKALPSLIIFCFIASLPIVAGLPGGYFVLETPNKNVIHYALNGTLLSTYFSFTEFSNQQDLWFNGTHWLFVNNAVKSWIYTQNGSYVSDVNLSGASNAQQITGNGTHYIIASWNTFQTNLSVYSKTWNLVNTFNLSSLNLFSDSDGVSGLTYNGSNYWVSSQQQVFLLYPNFSYTGYSFNGTSTVRGLSTARDSLLYAVVDDGASEWIHLYKYGVNTQNFSISAGNNPAGIYYSPGAGFLVNFTSPSPSNNSFLLTPYSSIAINTSISTNKTIYDIANVTLTVTDPVGMISNYTMAFSNTSNPPYGGGAFLNLSLHNTSQGNVLMMNFDEGQGTIAVDQSGMRNDGTLNGATWNKTGGRYGGALNFDGVNDYIEVADSSSIDVTTDLTLAARFYIRGAQTSGFLVKMANGGPTSGYRLMLEGGTYLRADIYTLSVGSVGSNILSPVALNTWVHGAVTYNGSHIVLYLNGLQVDSTPLTGNIGTNSLNLEIGQLEAGSGLFLNGTIDELIIFNRSLSASEVWSLYNRNGSFYATQNGLYQYRVTANDTAGNSNTTETRTFTIDTTPPIVSIISPTNTTYCINDIWYNVSLIEVNPSTVVAELDSTMNYSLSNSSGIWNYQHIDLADGPHTIRIYANDTAGNVNNSETISFTINTNVGIDHPINAIYSNPFVYLDVFASSGCGGIDVWRYQLDGGGNVSFTPNITVSGLNPGAHNIVVWGNLTQDGAWRNSIVYFTIDYRQGSISLLPPTPAGGAQVEAYSPVTIRVRLINTSVTSFTAPVLYFLVNNTVGTYGMNYLSGGGNNVTFERTLTLPPGSFAFWAKTHDNTGAAYISGNRTIGVYSRLQGGLPLVVTFTGSTPKSHDSVIRASGISVQGYAENINGTLSAPTLYLLNQDGSITISTTTLDSAVNSDGSVSLWGHVTVPSGHSSVYIQLGVTDNSGTAYSVRREINVVDNNEDSIVHDSLGLFSNVLPDERGSPEIGHGRLLAATITGMALMGASFASGAGAIPAVGIGILVGIEFSLFNVIPGYVSIVLVLLLAVVGAKAALNIFGG